MEAVSGTISSRLLAAGTAVVLGLTGAVAVTGPALAAGHATPGAPGLGDRLYPLLGNGGYDVQNYDLVLTYPKKDPAQQITGDVTITAVATQNLSRFDLDFGGDAVGGVTVNGRRATFTRDGDELVISPARALPAHRRFTVRVSGFKATPIQPDADAPVGFVVTPDGTVLAGQPASSHLLFPSNDHPRDKATYTITAVAPQGWTATANGVRVRTKTRNGYVTSTFRETNPMASELVQVAVGDFVVQNRAPVNGVPVRDVVPRRLADDLLPKVADERHEISWMEGKVGRYPFENYGSLIIDGELGFALETQTLSLYDTSFTGYPSYILNPILTHELAHQWFGDSVSPWSWSDVWQNEGHATWYEVTYADETGTLKQYTGAESLDAYFKSVYARGDQFRARFGPVARPLKADSIWDVFNPNVYDGGALVLFALRQKIGATKFQRVERAWVSRYRGKSASTQDFIRLASAVSGQNLGSFLGDWLYGTTTPAMPGHPDWTVTPVPASGAPASVAAAPAGARHMPAGH
ncbi:M1 family metallopeptidase [Couchioplanes caeruleus]|uniref:M1 family metallopeptidase n=1 Tax=Couchioplanes caeruleus TaxID=56438 RepID=UPI0020BEA5A1|nr:M1 family metallopeptidase [Couchioplanes caeruleus]UQU62848.1 M1 family metallopeptidase [Couchioplanes caeruleus]